MLVDSIKEIQKKLLDRGVTSGLHLNTTWNEEEVSNLEAYLNTTLPQTLKKIFFEEAGGMLFKWNAPIEQFGGNCKRCYFHLLSPQEIAVFYEDMIDMVKESITDQSELATNEGLQALVKDWGNWIPIFRFPNGDAFCIDKSKDGIIVFLEHDVMDGGTYIHGTKIAQNFDDLLSKWKEIAFVDVFDWSQVATGSGINIEIEHFTLLRDVFGR